MPSSKSPSRKSPARKSRSRSRSRGRSKSPARTTKAKAKTSPSPSPSRQSPARKSASTSKVPKTPTTPTRASARIAAIEAQDKQKTVEKVMAESIDQLSIYEVFKEPHAKNEKQQNEKLSPKKKAAQPRRSWNIIGSIKGFITGPVAMLVGIVSIPLFVLAYNLACGKSKCTVKELPTFPTDVKKYYNTEVVYVAAAYVVVQVVLSMLPVGRVIEGPARKGASRLQYRCNALVSMMMTFAAFGVMAYMKLPVTYFYNHFLQFIATSVAFGFLLSIVLYIKGGYASKSSRSIEGNTGNMLTDFFFGRETNPRFGRFDVKHFLVTRIFFMGSLLLNASMILHDYQKTGEVNVPASLVAAFQAFYALEPLFFEEHMLSGRAHHEPTGYYMSMGNFLAVFFFNFHVRFLIQHPQAWSLYYLIGMSFLNMLGFLMMFGSIAQKDQFRRNPHDPALAHLERIPTSNGKGLLVGGWWSMCRKPNYLGDIIQSFCWASLCGFEYAMPYAYPVLVVLLLVDRQRKDAADCRSRYGAAWDRYCERIKYRIIPYVY